MSAALGIDLSDGRRARVVSVDASGRLLARASAPAAPGPLAAAVRKVQSSRRSPASRRPAVGVTRSTDGGPDADTAIGGASRIAAAPVVVTPGEALVLAEAWCGAARGLRHVVALSIAERVDAGILAGGRLFKGASGNAAAVEWLALNPVEREDYRQLGGFAAEVAGGALVRRLGWRAKLDDGDSATRSTVDVSRATPARIVAAARAGDHLCLSILRDASKYVGMSIANLVAILDPQCVVLAGTFATAGDVVLDWIRGECRRRLSPERGEALRLLPSALGRDAAAIGAARAALTRAR